MKRVFLCRHRDHTDDDDYREVLAFDAEDAAKMHAEHIFNNCDGWEYMPNNSIPILVKDGDTVSLFSVYTEFYPSFSATEATHDQ
ncbi:MAG: hypothetical protein EB117_09180 [Betaproteobacteria bacterium]|nr:hypothetical protein [Betaproteobacteria bacterium]